MKRSIKNKTKTLKIGLVLDDSLDRNDGVQQYVRTLGGWLSDQGHTVHYLAGQSAGDDQTVHSLSKNLGVRFNRNRLTIPLPASTSAIKRLLQEQAYDVLHVQMPYNPMLAGKIVHHAPSSTAVVGTFHIVPFGPLQQYGSKALAIVQKRTLARFDAIASVSEAAQAFASAQFNLSSIVIPNMISLTSWRNTADPVSGLIVFLGRLVPRKGCKELLAAVAALPPHILDRTELIVAGDGPERQKLERFVHTQRLQNVNFLGFIKEEDKPALLGSADLAVFPATGGESFGIVLIEAMAAGAGAVIGGNNIGYQSVLSSFPEVLVDPTKTASFSQQLERFLSDRVLHSRIHKLQEKAVKQYDTNVVGHQILTLYHDGLLHRR